MLHLFAKARLILILGLLCTACNRLQLPNIAQPEAVPVRKNASGQTVIHIPSPSPERDGNTLEGIDDNAPIETSVTPKLEPIIMATTKPYVFNGETIVPMSKIQPFTQTGLSSWYGLKFHGKPTASGEPYSIYKLTAAHKILPIPSYVRVTNLLNQKSVIVRVNDRGPFSSKRILDVSYAAAKQLDMLREGSTQVQVELINTSDSRSAQQTPAQTQTTGTVSPSNIQENTPAIAEKETAPLAQGLYLQAGAFTKLDNAARLQQQIIAQLPKLQGTLNTVYNGSVHQILIGPYPDRTQATQVAEQLKARLQLRPIIISR